MLRFLTTLLALGGLLLGSPAAAQQKGPRFGLDGSIRSPTGSYRVDGATGELDAIIGPSRSLAPGTGAIARTVNDRIQDTVNVTDFCPRTSLNGSTNNTTCVQAAVTSICNRGAGGGTLYWPAGSYVVTSVTIPCSGVTLRGAGVGDRDNPSAQGTRIFAAATGSPSAPVFLFDAPSPSPYSFGGGVKDLAIVQGTFYRTGAYIEMRHVTQGVINNVYFYAPCTAIKLYGGFQIHISDYIAVNFAPNCKVMYLVGDKIGGDGPGGAGPNALDVVYFDHGTVNANDGGSCFAVEDRVHSVYWNNTVCQTAGQSLVVSCPTMASPLDCPAFFVLDDFESEGYRNTMPMISLTDMVLGFRMTNSFLRGWDGGATLADNIVASYAGRFNQSSDLTINNSWLKYARGSCLYLETDMVTISGNHIYGCNKGNFGAVGIELRKSNGTVTGNVLCGDDSVVHAVNWPMAAGLIVSGVDYTAWTGNVFSPDIFGGTNGCTAGIVNPGSATHNVILGNAGL